VGLTDHGLVYVTSCTTMAARFRITPEAGIFGGLIASLIDTGYIQIVDASDRDITEEIRCIGDTSDWSLRRGYKVAESSWGARMS